jgi:aryl-alcohol dehydrogenase-like predicted oxidoreductase
MGGFIRRWMTDEVLASVDRLRTVADQAGMTVAQLALAWVLREANVASAIIGASRPSQLEENCAAAGRLLDADVLAAAEKAVAEVVER